MNSMKHWEKSEDPEGRIIEMKSVTGICWKKYEFLSAFTAVLNYKNYTDLIFKSAGALTRKQNLTSALRNDKKR